MLVVYTRYITYNISQYHKIEVSLINTYMTWLKKHLLTIILIALVITCLAVNIKMAIDINELYKHIDILNLFYRNLEVGLPV